MARLVWGNDGILWGQDNLIWDETGATVTPVAPPTRIEPRVIVSEPEEEFRGAVPIYLHALLSVFFEPALRMWTGFEELEFNGLTYRGALTHLGFNMGNRQSQAGGRAGRVPISFNIPDAATDLRELLLLNRPSGLEAELMIVYSMDGERWFVAPNVTKGRLQNARFQGGTYSIEIVNPDLEAYRAPELFWSHTSQLNKYNGLDLGFESAAAIANGSTVARFPQDVPGPTSSPSGGVSETQPSTPPNQGGGGDQQDPGQSDPEEGFPGDDPDADPGPR